VLPTEKIHLQGLPKVESLLKKNFWRLLVQIFYRPDVRPVTVADGVGVTEREDCIAVGGLHRSVRGEYALQVASIPT